MSSDWKTVVLEDALDELIDYRGKTPKKSESGIPLITAKIVKNGRIETPAEFISEDIYDEWMQRGLPEKGDVVMTTEAPLGEIAQLYSANVALAQRIVTLRGKKGLLNNDYLLYLMQSDFVQHQLEARASGSTVRGIKQSELRKIDLLVPSLEEQEEIANQLKTIDKKIHLNQQTNETLEAMAQVIFKSWFVDFDPVRAKIKATSAGRDPNRAAMAVIAGFSLENDWDEIEAALDQKLARMSDAQLEQLTHTAQLFPDELVESEIGEVPKGWGVKSIDSLTKKVSKGTTPSRKARANADDEPSIKFLKVKDVDENGVIDRSDLSLISKSIHLNQLKRSILYENDILFSIAGTIGRVTFIDEELENSNCNQALAFIRLKDVRKHFNLLLLNLKSKRIQDEALSLIVQGVQANLSLTNIKDFEIIVPEDELLTIWNSVISDIMQMINSKQQENRSLSELRDTLLPKLISGEISINN